MDRQIELLQRQLMMALDLLKRSFPYVNRHYLSSRGSLGGSALKLKKEIEDFVTKLTGDDKGED